MGLTQKLGTIPLAILTDTSNNVGIGAAPSGSYKLEVTGTAKVSSTLLLGGALTGTSATFSGNVTLNAYGNQLKIGSNGGTDGFIGIGSGQSTMFIGDYAVGNKGLTLNLSTGAATFSSSVALGQSISTVGTNGILYHSTNNNLYIQGGSSGVAMYSDGGRYNASFVMDSSTQALYFGTAGSTKMTITNGGNIGAPSGTNIYNASDIRLKQNITTITNGLDKISALNPVKFNWVDGFEPSEDGKDMLGFIAQEVQDIIPEAVENFGKEGNIVEIDNLKVTNPLRVNEKFIIPVLVKAIQEQQATITSLQERLNKAGL